MKTISIATGLRRVFAALTLVLILLACSTLIAYTCAGDTARAADLQAMPMIVMPAGDEAPQDDDLVLVNAPQPIYDQLLMVDQFDPSIYPDGTVVLVHYDEHGRIDGYWPMIPGTAIRPRDYPAYWGFGWVYNGRLTIWM